MTSFLTSILLLFISVVSLAKPHRHFISPFPSSIKTSKIPNHHLVYKSESNTQIYRGMALVKAEYLQSIQNMKIDDILIVKKDSKGEVLKETTALKKLGYKQEQIHQIAIDWKEKSKLKMCNDFVEAYQFLKNYERQNTKKLYFHCTVGEDRTGILAGLLLLSHSKNKLSDKNKIFNEELCQRGYGSGNPNKPDFVVKPIRENLTPIWHYLSTSLAKNNTLTKEDCDENKIEAALQEQNMPICKPSVLEAKEQIFIYY